MYSPAINIILIIGGFYLAYEGVEKIVEFLFHREKKGSEVIEEAQKEITENEEVENTKVKSAVTTDFILSLEIVIIALASAKEGYNSLKSEFDPFLVEIFAVSVVSIIATIGVYGIVALIVRMDDAGFKLIKKSNDKGLLAQLGHLLVKGLPVAIKVLGIIGTIALILVAGGIFDHNIDKLHHSLPTWNETLKQVVFGIVGGLLAFFVVSGGKKIYTLVTNK